MSHILIADNQPIVRIGLRRLLECDRDLNVIGEVANGQELQRFLKRQCPDLLILDLIMPSFESPVEFVKSLKKKKLALKY